MIEFAITAFYFICYLYAQYKGLQFWHEDIFFCITEVDDPAYKDLYRADAKKLFNTQFAYVNFEIYHFYVSIFGLFIYLVWSSFFAFVKQNVSCCKLDKTDPFTKLVIYSEYDFMQDDSLIMYFFNIQTINIFQVYYDLYGDSDIDNAANTEYD